MFERIKKWYHQGLWTDVMIHTAVAKGILTAEQEKEILQ